MTINPKQYPKLASLVAKHEKNIDAFQAQATAFFHPYAVALCRQIQKGIPEFEGAQLAMRELYLEPRDLQIPITYGEGDTLEHSTERLQNILDYIRFERKLWTVNLPAETLAALTELDELSNYIDDNYSMVGDLNVTLADEPAPKSVRKPLAVKEHKRLMKMDFNRIAADIRKIKTVIARQRRVKEILPQLKASNPRFDLTRFYQACNA